MMNHKKLHFVLLLFLLAISPIRAQEKQQVELFCGAELNFAEINFARLYNVLINLTPGVKYHMGHNWMLSSQVVIPIVNDGYDDRYNMIRLNMLNISKEVHFTQARQYLKFTAGLFGMERYGLDVRWMFPINSWLMVNSRVGVTGGWVLGFDFDGNYERKFNDDDWSVMAIGGANFWLAPWVTEFRLLGGRFMNKDYGVEGEVLRHFKHVTVSLFGQYHENAFNIVGKPHRFSGGFRVVIMLPPYKKSDKTVVFRPASNFRFTNNAQADEFSVKRYMTDPEENERTQPIHVPWGTGNFNER